MKFFIGLVFLLTVPQILLADSTTMAPPAPVTPQSAKVINENETPRVEEVGKRTQGKRLAKRGKTPKAAKRRLASAKVSKASKKKTKKRKS